MRVALDGLAAMRFQGIRLLPSLQREVLKSTSDMPAECRFIGAATSASRVESGGWAWWHNQGRGALQLLAGYPTDAIWLDGDSQLTRSLAVALVAEGGRLAEMFSQVLWSGAPQAELNDFGDGGESLLSELHLGITSVSREEAVAACTEQRVAICSESLGDLGLILEGRDQPISCDLVGEGSEQLTQMSLLEVQSSADLNEVDLAGEAWDFAAWTGNQIAIELLHEALEEFSGF